MPSYDPEGTSLEVADADTPLGRDAEDESERRLTLTWALNNTWMGESIGALERWDQPNFKGWVMWPWLEPE